MKQQDVYKPMFPEYHSMIVDNEWNGLADLLANLIAKYASELGVDNITDVSNDDEYSGNSEIL